MRAVVVGAKGAGACVSTVASIPSHQHLRDGTLVPSAPLDPSCPLGGLGQRSQQRICLSPLSGLC